MYSAFYKMGARSMSAAVMFAMLAGPFMALIPQTAQAVSLPTCTVVSNSDVQESGSDSFELVAPYRHSAWTASIPGAAWIWGDAMVATPTTDETQTFTATFDLTNAPTGAVLDVAADNSYSVSVGSLATSVTDENNFKPETQDTYTGITGLVAGTNTLTFTVTNKGVPGSTATDNPAGLLFKLTVTGANCGAPTAAPVISYPANGATLPAVASVDWNDIADPESPVTYQYQSSLSPATNPDGSFVTPAYTSGPLTTSEIPTPGTPYGTYYVHAKAIDNNGNQSAWGPTSTFTVASAPVIPACDPGADPTTFDPFTLGNVNGQFGWISTGAFDQEIVDNTYGYPTFGCKSLRLSNAVTSGSFGDQTFSYSIANEAGETTAENGGQSGGIRKERFEAEFDIASTKPNEYQPDLRITVSPDRGDGARMSFLRFEDTSGGIDVTFFDVQSTGDPANFVAEVIAEDLSRSVPHTVKIVMDFVEGPAIALPANDVVKIYIDNVLVHTGTSWENYYRFDNESNPMLNNTSRTVDSLLFRLSGTAAPVNDEEGFLIDNMSIQSSDIVEEVETASVTVCKVADVYSEEPVFLPGWNVFLQGEEVVGGSFLVPTNVSAGTTTGSILSSGTSYLAKVFGTWTNQGGVNQVDAEYSSTDNFGVNIMDGYTGYSTDILELQINQTFDPNSNWGPYNSLHEYAQSFIASSTTANFRIFDGTGTTQNESWFGDNSGTLAVDLYNGFSGITGKDGCVTFENVPLGNYTIGETPQDGWEDVTKKHDVVVTEDAEDNVFYLYNYNEEFGNESCEIVSSMTTLEGGTWTYENEGPFHPSWTAVVDTMSFWIWGDEDVDDPTSEETQTFTKTFWLESLPAVDATLTIAADNSYMVELNGTWSSSDGDEDNYTNAGKDVITVPAEDFVLGANTIVFTVTNFAQGGGTQQSNPAGLNYKLAIPGAECSEEPIDQPFVKVHIYKYILDENEEIAPATEGDPSFPMVSTWNAANIGSGSGSYTLTPGSGFYAATSPMTQNADYTTSEVTDGSIVVPMDSKSCPAGKYRLVGYKTGDTLIEAENDAIDDDAPAFTSLDADKYVIVVNEDCDELDTPPTAQVKVHIYKTLLYGEGPLLIENGADIDPFDMVSTWKADNLNGGATSTGSYVLGNYHGGAEYQFAADTSAMDVGANYTTYEVTGENGIVPIGGTCTEGAYRLVGYKVGASFLEARDSETLYTEAPFLSNLQSDKTIIVVNEDCDDVDESTPPVIGTESFSNGGGGGNNDSDGEVLGDSTDSCDALLTTYLSQGGANSVDEVTKLQGFLNENLGITLPLTGTFGSMTDAAVRQFQVKYWEDVLEPWFGIPGSGITSKDTPTGYVYKTTKWKINDLYCPGSETYPLIP